MASKTLTRSVEVPMYSDRVCMKLSVSKIKRIVYNGHNEVWVGKGEVVDRKDSTVS